MSPDELDDECNTTPCDACDGSGRSVDGRWLWTIVNYLVLVAEEGSRPSRNGLHPWLRAIPIAPRHPRNPMAIDPPTREMARLVKGLAGYEGHQPHEVMKKIVVAAGLPESWGECSRCDGHGFLSLRPERYG